MGNLQLEEGRFIEEESEKLASSRAKKKNNVITGTPLRPKQVAFVLEYVRCKDGREACIKAGYSPKYADSAAFQLLRNPYVQQAIQKSLEEIRQRKMLTAEKILMDIAQVGEMCKAAIQTVDENGNQTVNAAAASQALKAAELLGKHLELFTDKAKEERKLNVSVVVHEEQASKLPKIVKAVTAVTEGIECS